MGKGQLLFKGDKPKSKSKHKKHKSKKKSKDSSGNDGLLGAATAPASAAQSTSGAAAGASSASASASTSAAAAQSATPTITKGSGKITTSGSVIMGHGTKFMKEINVGDAILVDIVDGGGGGEEQQQQEMRVVTMRLSDTSINLSSGFSVSLSSPTPFHYIRKPRNIRQEQREKQKARDEETKERQMHAFDVYGGSNTLVYREKTETGSYRIKTESLDDQNGASSRQRLLDLRAKKTSDKYC